MFGEPVTVAVNCWVWLALRLTADGDREMATPCTMDTEAIPDFDGSAALTACTITFVRALMLAGAV